MINMKIGIMKRVLLQIILCLSDWQVSKYKDLMKITKVFHWQNIWRTQ